MQPKKVLIVEDEAIVAMHMRKQLTMQGYEVCDPVGTGEQSIQSAREYRPDLILMDIRLADRMDGIEATEQIRTFTRVPVIFITGFPDESLRQRALKLQPSDYLIKPLWGESLKKAIDRIFQL